MDAEGVVNELNLQTVAVQIRRSGVDPDTPTTREGLSCTSTETSQGALGIPVLVGQS